MRRPVRAWLLAAQLALFAAMAQGAEPRILFETSLEDPLLDIELRGATIAADAIELVAVRTTRTPPSSDAALVWATVTGGKLATQADALEVPAPGALDVARLVVAVPGGVAFLAEGGPEPGPALARFSGSRSEPVLYPFNPWQAGTSIRYLASLSSESLLLAGNLGSRPWLGEATLGGAVSNGRLVPVEGVDLMKVVPDTDGTVIVLGTRRTLPDAATWIARVARDGRVIAEVEVEGRASDIARAGDGRYAVLATRVRTGQYAIAFIGLNSALEVRSEQVLSSSVVGPVEFRVAGVAASDFIVAGVENRGLWLSRVGADGQRIWMMNRNPEQRDDSEMVARVELLSGADAVYVAYTAFVVRDRQQRKTVRVMGVDAR